MSRNHTPSNRRGPAGGAQPPTKGPRPSGRQGREQITKIEEKERAAAQSRRTVRRTVGALVILAVVVLAVIVALTAGSSGLPPTPVQGLPVVPGPNGPESVPIEQGQVLASAASSATGQTVDGVACNSTEQLASHIHAHVSIYVNGVLRPIPAGIGIVAPVGQTTPSGAFYSASHCYYWLHVHAQDGVIHIESPPGHTYTLGQFFDLWGQPLGTGQVGPAVGPLTMWIDGHRYRGDPRAIPLSPHEDIQIDVGRPVVGPHAVRWSATSL